MTYLKWSFILKSCEFNKRQNCDLTKPFTLLGQRNRILVSKGLQGLKSNGLHDPDAIRFICFRVHGSPFGANRERNITLGLLLLPRGSDLLFTCAAFSPLISLEMTTLHILCFIVLLALSSISTLPWVSLHPFHVCLSPLSPLVKL